MWQYSLRKILQQASYMRAYSIIILVLCYFPVFHSIKSSAWPLKNWWLFWIMGWEGTFRLVLITQGSKVCHLINPSTVKEENIDAVSCHTQLMCLMLLYLVFIYEFWSILTTYLCVFKRMKSSDVTQKYLSHLHGHLWTERSVQHSILYKSYHVK